ncbi:MAG: hypothetical protein WB507_10695 [Solirubrobacterales bacterium]
MKAVQSRLTFANVISCLALFIALGGAAYAATKLPANSVGTKQLKGGAVTAAKVKSGSLLASNFAAGQLPAGPQGLTGEDGREGHEGREGAGGPRGLQGEPGQRGEQGLKGEKGEKGETGAKGDQGLQGEKGDTGEKGEAGEAGTTKVVTRYGTERELLSGSANSSYAACETGEAVTGGGFDFTAPATDSEYNLQADRPSLETVSPKLTTYPRPTNGSAAIGWIVGFENRTSSSFAFRSYVMCASS